MRAELEYPDSHIAAFFLHHPLFSFIPIDHWQTAYGGQLNLAAAEEVAIEVAEEELKEAVEALIEAGAAALLGIMEIRLSALVRHGKVSA